MDQANKLRSAVEKERKTLMNKLIAIGRFNKGDKRLQGLTLTELRDIWASANGNNQAS